MYKPEIGKTCKVVWKLSKTEETITPQFIGKGTLVYLDPAGKERAIDLSNIKEFKSELTEEQRLHIVLLQDLQICQANFKSPTRELIKMGWTKVGKEVTPTEIVNWEVEDRIGLQEYMQRLQENYVIHKKL